LATTLSARALSSLVTQLCGVLGASVEKQRKRLFQYEKTPNSQLLKQIEQNAPQKPNITKLNPELSSKCVDIEKDDGEFNYFIRLKSIGDSFGHIKIPIKLHKHNRKFKDWKLKTSFLFTPTYINFRWENDAEAVKDGNVLGCDQGKLDVITLSNGFTAPKTNIHGKSLSSIMTALSKCKKGSGRFKRKQDERKNFINWSINQIPLNGIKQINLEEIWSIGYKTRKSRTMSHWTNTLIRDKIKARCEELGVQVRLQSCTYRSQRCSSCGLVRKSQRKGKLYSCECGFKSDSDLNAALNHEVELPDIPWELRRERRNINGFYWLESGFFDLNRVEFRVSLTKNQG
jgi:transposase